MHTVVCAETLLLKRAVKYCFHSEDYGIIYLEAERCAVREYSNTAQNTETPDTKKVTYIRVNFTYLLLSFGERAIVRYRASHG
jgi:hypothetical protein